MYFVDLRTELEIAFKQLSRHFITGDTIIEVQQLIQLL